MGNLFARLWASLANPFRGRDEDTGFTRNEKILVVVVAYLMGIGLWFMVNMDGEYSLTIRVPVQLGEIPSDRALANPIPDAVDVTVTGNGWKLLNVYNSPPALLLDVRQEEVDVLAATRVLFGTYDGLAVQRTSPFVLSVRLEDRIRVKVPVDPRLDIAFRNRYDQVGEPRLFPDSIWIEGARSRLDTIRSWPTESEFIEDVREDLDLTLGLATPPEILMLSHASVRMEVSVSEYTEGEVRVPVRVRGEPRGQSVVFTPAQVTVRFDVPISEYGRSQTQPLFAAYVSYSATMRDSTGFVIPQIERVEQNLNLRLRSVLPRSVGYYHVMTD